MQRDVRRPGGPMDEQRETLAGGFMRDTDKRAWKRDHGGTKCGAATHCEAVGAARAVLPGSGVPGAMLFHVRLRENTRARNSRALEYQRNEYEAMEQASRHRRPV